MTRRGAAPAQHSAPRHTNHTTTRGSTQYCQEQGTAQHGTARHGTAGTVRHSTAGTARQAQHGIARRNTAEHTAAQLTTPQRTVTSETNLLERLQQGLRHVCTEQWLEHVCIACIV